MTPEREDSVAGYTTLSSTLWRLREVLDLLLFKVFETQLVLGSDQSRWLARTARELDAALQEVRHVEVMRAVETVAIADDLGVPPDITLGLLVRAAPPPWDTILLEHRDALVELTSELATAAAAVPNLSAGTDVDLAGLDSDDALDLVRDFLAQTLARAPQASLMAFLA